MISLCFGETGDNVYRYGFVFFVDHQFHFFVIWLEGLKDGINGKLYVKGSLV